MIPKPCPEDNSSQQRKRQGNYSTTYQKTGGTEISRSCGPCLDSSRPTGTVSYSNAKLVYRVGQIVAEKLENEHLTEEDVVQRLQSKYEEYRRTKKVHVLVSLFFCKLGCIIVIVTTMMSFVHGTSTLFTKGSMTCVIVEKQEQHN